MTDQIFALTAFDVPTRIVAELLRMSERDGGESDVATISPLPTHESLAMRIGTSREAVTRTLGQLARDGFIRKERSRITILSHANMLRLLPQ
jgi:CRP-like cAMP-binding protein